MSDEEKKKVILCCNDNLISDTEYDSTHEYPSQWFASRFDFLGDAKLSEHLGDEFYQTRFAYTLMQTLSLRMSKNKGIVKFQIIQYASICEALLNYTIRLYFKDEFENEYAAITYADLSSALPSKTKITFDGQPLFLCKQKTEKAKIDWSSNPIKAKFALKKGILSEKTKNEYCALYELRNNAHILRATSADYYPKIKEAGDAYELTYQFINEIKEFFQSHPNRS